MRICILFCTKRVLFIFLLFFLCLARSRLMQSRDLLPIHRPSCSSIYVIDSPDWLKTQIGTMVEGKVNSKKFSVVTFYRLNDNNKVK